MKQPTKTPEHFVYIVRCADGTLYTGYTTDLERRVREHNGEGNTKTDRSVGARYTRARRPITLVYSEVFPTRSAALRRECAIKHLTREQKLKLCEQNDPCVKQWPVSFLL